MAAAARRAADTRKVKNDTQEEIANIKQWVNVVRKEKGLLVVEVYTDWAGPCDPMVRYMKRAKFDLPKDYQEMVKCYVLSADDVSAIFESKCGKARPLYLFFVARGRLVDVHPPLNRPPVVNPIVMGEQIKKWTELAAKFEFATLETAGRSAKENLDFYFPLVKNDAVLSVYKVSAEDAYVAEEALNARQAELAAAAAARKSAGLDEEETDEEEMDEEEAERIAKELEEMRNNAAATQSTAALAAVQQREEAERKQAEEAAAAASGMSKANAPLLGVMLLGTEGTSAMPGGGELTQANTPSAPDGSSLAEPIMSDNTQPIGEANKNTLLTPDSAGGAGGGGTMLRGSSSMEDPVKRAKSIERQDTITITYHKKANPPMIPARDSIQPGASNFQDQHQIDEAIKQKVASPTDGSTATTGPPDGRGELFHPTELVRPNEPVNPAAQAAEGTGGSMPSTTTADIQQQIQRAAEQDDADAAASQSVPYDVEHSHARAELAARLANPVIEAGGVFEPSSELAQNVMEVNKQDGRDLQTSLAGFSNVDPFKLQASIEHDALGFYDDLVGNNQAASRNTFTAPVTDTMRLSVNQPEAGRPTYGEKFVEELVTGESSKDEAMNGRTTPGGTTRIPSPGNATDQPRLSPEQEAEVATEVEDAINRAIGSVHPL